MSKQLTFTYDGKTYTFTLEEILELVGQLNDSGKFIVDTADLAQWTYHNLDLYQENLLFSKMNIEMTEAIQDNNGDVENLVKLVVAAGLIGFYNGFQVSEAKQGNSIH